MHKKPIPSLSVVWQRKKQSAVPPNNYCGTTTACTLSSILPPVTVMHLKALFRLSIKCVNPVSLLSATLKRFPNKCSVMLTKLGLKCRNLLLSLPAARVFQVAFSGLFFGLYGMNEKRSSESVIFVFRRLEARCLWIKYTAIKAKRSLSL